MLHLFANFASVVTATDTDLTPVQDAVQTIINGHFLPSRDIQVKWACPMGTNLQYARLITPSTRQITSPFLLPINAALVPVTRPYVVDYTQDPITLRGVEEVEILVNQTAGANQNITVVWAAEMSNTPPAPAGTVYTLRGTSATAVVANVWSQINMAWIDTLPQGVYAVIGLQHFSTNGQASRLIFKTQVERPGTLSLATQNLINNPLFRMGNLGEMGRFNTFTMPNVEVLANAADAAHVVYLDIVRIA